MPVFYLSRFVTWTTVESPLTHVCIPPQITEYKVGVNTTVSRMEITPAKQKDAGFYECQADNKYAFDRRGFRTDFIIHMD